MASQWIKKIDKDGYIVSLTYTAWALFINDDSVIPNDYKMEKRTITIDKIKLKKDIQDWTVILPWIEVKKTPKLKIKLQSEDLKFII